MTPPDPTQNGFASPCCVCGGTLEAAWSGRLMGHVDVTYALCTDCGSLSLPEPHWLEEAYSKVVVPDPDYGSLTRTLFIHRCIRRMRAHSIGLVPRRCRTLDFGCGKGFLLRSLLDEGREAWGYDPYPQAVFAQDRVLSTLPEDRFDLITATEVLEHTTDPVQVLSSLRARLEPNGVLLVSTELFHGDRHGADWVYLAPDLGQHITFYSPEGLRRVVEASGLQWVGSLPFNGIEFLHVLLPKEREPISRWRWWSLLRRHAKGEKRLMRDSNI